MRYEFKGKKINIPDTEIEKSMKILELTQEEAIQMYLEDNGYLENEEVEALTKKAKENGADKIINRATPTRKTQTERKPKENPLKEQIIASLHKFLLENSELSQVNIINKSKTIDFYVNEKHFSLNLTEHRPKKA